MRKCKRKKVLPLLLAFLITFTSFCTLPLQTEAAADAPILKFDFGTAASSVQDRYTAVTPETAYSEAAGYGFEDISKVSAIDRKTSDPLKSDFVSVSDTSFNVDVAYGDYTVTILSGDEDAGTNIGIQVEDIQKVQSTHLASGEYKEQEFEISLIDGQLNFTFTEANSKINAIIIEKIPERTEADNPTVYMAGDSTVQTYDEYWRPEAGWGQMIPRFFTSEIEFENHAIGGRSSKTFIKEGRLDEILRVIKPNDYFLIQFGHNDATISVPERYASVPDYKKYLKSYVLGARQRGAIPILVTPMGRRDFNEETGEFRVSFSEYVQGMQEVAEELDVKVIDLSARSVAYYNSIGPEGTLSVFLYTDPGVYPAFPNGSKDNTHFQEYGAIQLARLVADEISNLDIPLSEHVKKIEAPKKAPAKPSKVTISKISNAGALVSWKKSKKADIYRIYSKPSTSDAYKLVGTSTIPQLFLTGLDEETSYDVYVTAVNGKGESAHSKTKQFTTSKAMKKFDFGLTGNPVKEGFQEVNLTTLYTAERGYGIVNAENMIGRDRNIGDDVVRDWLGYFASEWEFNVDVPDGIYAVKIYVGDMTGSARTNLVIEGQDYGQVSAPRNNYTTRVVPEVLVEDGQINFGFGGSTGIVNGVEITAVGN
ncbi:SGNH/GDSL hydrolase family protein [Terribacillus sp. DMT04]|uniref:SGNH/GDSL hydrolase family protein n=1 Tax=Terribacillus sp. DMT04 TaxID=2850441 RepID=UPI001C2BD631|nr:SGNH/GDSL hydrolase family protein [Terribacillus sp. DMT04]QXE01012.1 fibronectin type III domain-containing protein [Terribacillus sp. DMT04]